MRPRRISNYVRRVLRGKVADYGCILNDDNRRRTEQLLASDHYAKVQTFKEAAPHLVGLGKKKLYLNFKSLEKVAPETFYFSQQTNDCTAVGSFVASEGVRCVEFDIKGEPEEYYKQTACEPIYGARRSRADAGMAPSVATRWLHDYGMVARQQYDGIDLTHYDVELGIRWGGGRLPEVIKQAAKQHPVQGIALCEELQDLIDGFAAGYLCHSGGIEGFSSVCDEEGFAARTTTWNHDMPTLAVDMEGRRPGVLMWTWGDWNDWDNPKHQPWWGQRPPGSFMIDAEIMDRRIKQSRSCWLLSDTVGWPAKNLPDYGTPEWA